MDTYFASSKRIDGVELDEEINIICNNPVINGLISISSSLFTVLNEHRQILAINETYINLLGIENSEEVFGLRVGESLKCIHGDEMPGRCGTSKSCASCGAAIAMVAGLENSRPVEETCVITVNKNQKKYELYFNIRCVPIKIDGKKFLLFFLQDISPQMQWDTLERTFIHDMNNYLTGLIGKAEQLLLEFQDNQLAEDIVEQSFRIARQIEIQRSLIASGSHIYKPLYQTVPISQIVKEIELMFSNSKIGKNKIFILPKDFPDVSLNTDLSLIIRVLGNLIKNAFEASSNYETVTFSVEVDSRSITFSVSNKQYIPEDIAKRMFERNFTTKHGDFRGLGTFSSKLFGEKMLGGVVDFKTSKKDGTVFTFQLANK